MTGSRCKQPGSHWNIHPSTQTTGISLRSLATQRHTKTDKKIGESLMFRYEVPHPLVMDSLSSSPSSCIFPPRAPLSGAGTQSQMGSWPCLEASWTCRTDSGQESSCVSSPILDLHLTVVSLTLVSGSGSQESRRTLATKTMVCRYTILLRPRVSPAS